MERVAFIVQPNDRRLACLLNPEHLEVRRSAGVRPRGKPGGGDLTSADAYDDPIAFTGGGRTELTMQLLFDVGVAGSTGPAPLDVRELTAPLWALSENSAGATGARRRPPLVRFVWGKVWNVPGVVVDIAERLERFATSGAPTRSWLSLRLLRVIEDPPRAPALPPPPRVAGLSEIDPTNAPTHLTAGGSSGPTERLDRLATRYYGNPAWWRIIAEANGIDDPLDIPPGLELRIPPLEEVLRLSPLSTTEGVQV